MPRSMRRPEVGSGTAPYEFQLLALFRKVDWLAAANVTFAAVDENVCVNPVAPSTTAYFVLPAVGVAESKIT